MNRQVAYESRSAAMRSLLHDFNNIMVGLSAISDSVVNELPEDHPLQDELEIIRDSAQRAQELLRWLSKINSRFPDIVEQVELRDWLSGEAATLKALLPKGSEVIVEVPDENLQVRLIEEDLRDLLFVAAHDVALRAGARLRLTIRATSVIGGILIEIQDDTLNRPRSSVQDTSTHSVEQRAAFIDSVAGKYGATVERKDEADGVAFLRVRLPLNRG